MVLTRGADQAPVSTKFDMRSDPNVIRNYGKMLVSLAAVVPDGIVCFFVSYRYMDAIIAKWHEMGILQVKKHSDVTAAAALFTAMRCSSCHSIRAKRSCR